jgi:hypothetical protein
MYERARPDLPDEDPARGFEDRGVRLETTFQGAGVLTGDLTPECAAIVGAVLDALGAPAGAEDTRTREQRYHDALQEAMRWLCKCILILVAPAGSCPRCGGGGRCAGCWPGRPWPHDRAHFFFSCALWGADDLGLAVAQLVTALLVPAGRPVTVAIDDTLIKRRGR